jgi:hypothetical protein
LRRRPSPRTFDRLGSSAQGSAPPTSPADRGGKNLLSSVSVGTQLWNAPAHASYAKYGFSPHCVLVGRLREPTSRGDQAAV